MVKPEIPDTDSTSQPRKLRRKKQPKKQLELATPDKPMKWSKEEKRRLLDALKNCNKTDIKAITTKVGTRTISEVNIFIERLKTKGKRMNAKLTPSNAVLQTQELIAKAPIEHWLKKTLDLTYYEEDHSVLLEQVMSIAGSCEPHVTPGSSIDPDYGAIYQYIVTLLKGEPKTKDLSPINAAVVLDILQNLADTLKCLDTSTQKALMLEKYKLLSVKVALDSQTRNKAYEAAKRALTHDPLETPDDSSQPETVRIDSLGRAFRQKKQSPLIKPVASPLYSINPFCIPPKYLNLFAKKKVTQNSTATKTNWREKLGVPIPASLKGGNAGSNAAGGVTVLKVPTSLAMNLPKNIQATDLKNLKIQFDLKNTDRMSSETIASLTTVVQKYVGSKGKIGYVAAQSQGQENVPSSMQGQGQTPLTTGSQGHTSASSFGLGQGSTSTVSQGQTTVSTADHGQTSESTIGHGQTSVSTVDQGQTALSAVSESQVSESGSNITSTVHQISSQIVTGSSSNQGQGQGHITSLSTPQQLQSEPVSMAPNK